MKVSNFFFRVELRRLKSLPLVFVLIVPLSLIGCNACSENLNLSSNLPPDPGVAGRATLEGIDSNSNGVRDDIERMIHKRNPNIPPAHMTALMNLARAIQASVIAGASGKKSKMEKVGLMQGATIDCLFTLEDLSLDEMDYIEYIQAAVINTATRSKAYDTYNHSFDGQFSTVGETPDPCNQSHIIDIQM